MFYSCSLPLAPGALLPPSLTPAPPPVPPAPPPVADGTPSLQYLKNLKALYEHLSPEVGVAADAPHRAAVASTAAAAAAAAPRPPPHLPASLPVR